MHKLESTVSAQWLEYVQRTSYENVFDWLLAECCNRALGPWAKFPRLRGHTTESSWIKGIVLRKGPRFLRRLSDKDPDVRREAQNDLTEDVAKRSELQLSMEAETLHS